MSERSSRPSAAGSAPQIEPSASPSSAPSDAIQRTPPTMSITEPASVPLTTPAAPAGSGSTGVDAAQICFREAVRKIASTPGLSSAEKQSRIQELQLKSIQAARKRIRAVTAATEAARAASTQASAEGSALSAVRAAEEKASSGAAQPSKPGASPGDVCSDDVKNAPASAPEVDVSSCEGGAHDHEPQASSNAHYLHPGDGKFPGTAAKPCSHYARRCWLKAACCGKYYPCRRCHDEEEDHQIDRHATRFVGCRMCGAEDRPAEERCDNCGVRYARYFCRVCRFYNDTPGRDIYHCDQCGICRVGKGLGMDNYHCAKCNTCVPLEVAESHPCLEASLERNCPVCREFMATSTEQVVFMRCGHAIHSSCFREHTKHSYICPLCSKALTDMEAWYRALDKRLAEEVFPPEWDHRKTHILCNECRVKSTVKFHFMFHKCGHCGCYNTRVLSYLTETSRASEEETRQLRERYRRAYEQAQAQGLSMNRLRSASAPEKKEGRGAGSSDQRVSSPDGERVASGDDAEDDRIVRDFDGRTWKPTGGPEKGVDEEKMKGHNTPKPPGEASQVPGDGKKTVDRNELSNS